MKAPTFQWRWLLLALALSGGGIIFLYAFTKEGTPLLIFRSMRPQGLLLALSLVPGLWLTEALRMKRITAILGGELSLGQVFWVNLTASFLSAVTPFGSGGPPGQAYFFYRFGLPPEKSLAAVTARVLLTYFFFALIAPLALILTQGLLNFSPGVKYAVYLTALAIPALSFLFFFVILRSKAVSLFLQGLLVLPFLKKLFRNRRERFATGLERFNQKIDLFVKGGGEKLFAPFLYTFIYWSLFFALAPVLLWSLGQDVPWATVLGYQVTYYFLISCVPLPGGSGVAELGLASLFAPLLPSFLLAGFVATWRFFTYYLNILVGGFAFWYLVPRLPSPRIEEARP